MILGVITGCGIIAICYAIFLWAFVLWDDRKRRIRRREHDRIFMILHKAKMEEYAQILKDEEDAAR